MSKNGKDRAKYGDKLFKNLAERIAIKGLGETNLRLSRQFYNTYPEIRHLLFSAFRNWVPNFVNEFLVDETQRVDDQANTIHQMMSDEFTTETNSVDTIHQTVTDELKLEAKSDLKNLTNYYSSLILRTSFFHFTELVKIENQTKRKFYELFILKTTPSVKELQRQIHTLAYERVGLSASTEVAFEQLQDKIEPEKVSDAVKSIFLFDFLGLKTNELVEEQELETALLNHLQEFMLELGHGFCFESRQQRIFIDDEYYFVDLVFYHRILKCHVLVELKIDAFKHEHLSQLNTYVAYYREEVKRPDDNLPIGILLCTEKGKKLVEYALSGMDNHLFVSKYLLELPKKEQLEEFIITELKKWNNA